MALKRIAFALGHQELSFVRPNARIATLIGPGLRGTDERSAPAEKTNSDAVPIMTVEQCRWTIQSRATLTLRMKSNVLNLHRW